MSDIFISYKREEQAIARKLANALESEGWSVWWDPKLRAGEHFDDVIEKTLNEASCVIVLLSNLAVNSDYVKAEATEALEQKKLVPVKIDNVNLPFRFKRVHTPSLIQWDGSKDSLEFRRLVEDIAAIVGPPSTRTKRKTDKEKGEDRAQQKTRAQQTAEKEQLRKQERQWSQEEVRPKVDQDNPGRIDEQKEDIASRVVAYIADEFEKKHGKDLRKEKLALQRLKASAEKAINELSIVEETEVNLPFITSDSTGVKHLEMKLTRAKLEWLAAQQVKTLN